MATTINDRLRLRIKTSKRAAINLFCRECLGVGGDGGTPDDVRNCTATTCALWPHRPYQVKASGKGNVAD